MLQTIFEFLFSLKHVRVTSATRFALSLDAWSIPCILGVVFLALLFALIATIVSRKNEGRANGSSSTLLALIVGLIVSGVFASLAIFNATHGGIAETVVSIGLHGLHATVGAGLAVLILGVAGMAVLGYWSYRRQSASPGRRIGMGVLRAALLVLVLLLFCRPQLVLDSEERTRSVVAVWVDTSASMSLEDPYTDQGMRDFVKQVVAKTPLPAGQARPTRFQLAIEALSRGSALGRMEATQTRRLSEAGPSPRFAALWLLALVVPAALWVGLRRGSGRHFAAWRVAVSGGILAGGGALVALVVCWPLLTHVDKPEQASPKTRVGAAWLAELTENQDVEVFKGSTHATEVGTARSAEQLPGLIERLKAEAPTGESTDVPTVVQEIMQKVQGTRVSAIVLLTDGQTTEPGSRLDQAVDIAHRSSVKVFSLPLGQAEEPFDLALTGGMQVPETAFVRDPVSIKLRLTGAGIDRPTQAKVTLYRKQGEALTELASKEYTLDPSKKAIDAELIFKPNKKPGERAERYDLVAIVEPVGMAGVEELNAKNNQVSGSTTVLDAQINALYVDSSPRWEFRYLKNELIREKTVNVSTLLTSADELFPQEGDPRVVDKDGRETFPGPITRFPETPEEMGKYDVLFIGDVEPTYFSPTQQKLILDFVRKSGGGICWIAGSAWTPEAYKGTALEPLLPIIPDELDPRARVMAPVPNEPFTLMLTAAGRDSNLFRFFDDPDLNVKQMGELPEMYWYKPVLGLQPAAKVLAVHPTRTQGGTPVPLIVVGRFGNGRTVFSAVCDTWRWRRYMGEPLFQSYWLQMCRLLYQGKVLGQNKRIELAAESSRVEVGRPIKLTMDIRDPTLSPQVPAQVPVMLMDKDQHVVETVMLQRGTGEDGQDHLEGMTTATQIGAMSLAVAPGVLPVDLPPYEVTIEPPQREFQNVTTDVESLDTLATKTTGAVVPLYRAEELTKDIPDRSLASMRSDSEELWYKPIALALVVALATVEWLMRKRAGLI